VVPEPVPVIIVVDEPSIELVEFNPCQCFKCKKVLSCKSSLIQHQKICQGIKVKSIHCPICLKVFASKSSKCDHKRNVRCKPPMNLPETVQEKIARLENTIETLTSTITTLTGTIETLKNKPKPKRGALNGPVRLQIASDQKWHCSSCDIVFVSTFEVDHTIPLWDGGLDHRDNATALCVSCHALKTQNEWVMRSHKREHVSE